MAMATFGYYSNFTTFVMSKQELNESYLLLLQEALTPLRFYLSCRVCNTILQTPMSPDHTACQHTVCQKCIGGKMKLKPSCGWCQAYENFIENKSLAALVRCYSKLCKYVVSSADYRKQIDFITTSGHIDPAVMGYKEKVASLLKEGCDVDDADSVSSDSKNGKSEDYTMKSKGQSSKSNSCGMRSIIVFTHHDGNPSVSKSPSASSQSDTNLKSRENLKLKLGISGSNKKRRHYTAPSLTNSAKKSLAIIKKRRKIASSLSDCAALSSDTDGNASDRTPTKFRGKKKTINKADAENQEERLSLHTEKEESETRKKARKLGKLEKRGCGCGNATSTPGKLTCYGQRCLCYSNHNPCLDCKCRGCRNPNKVVKIEQASEDTDGDEINVE